MKARRILIATDLSKDGNAALRFAASYLLEADDELALLTVVSIVAVPEWPYEPAAEYERQAIERASRELEKLAESDLKRFRCERIVKSSLNVPEEICKVARDKRSDCILLGSHGAGALSNLFIGGTAQRVIRLSECPVMVIPRKVSDLESAFS